jgi:hypothetical protein
LRWWGARLLLAGGGLAAFGAVATLDSWWAAVPVLAVTVALSAGAAGWRPKPG